MGKNYRYHEKQFYDIKRSTISFVSWLKNQISFNKKKICDMACGAGANTFYLANMFPSSQFTGIDYDEDFLKVHNGVCPPPENCCLAKGDWYNLDEKYIGEFDGIISFQTLSWLQDYKEPIEKLCLLKPQWIALSSLFYEGRINYYIRIDDHEENYNGWGQDGGSYYNIYSLPLLQELFYNNGYTKFMYKKFDIDIELPKPEAYKMQTYTVKTADNELLQISGALLMPWYFILAQR